MHIPTLLLPTSNKEDFLKERFAKLIQAYLCFLDFVIDVDLSGVQSHMFLDSL